MLQVFINVLLSSHGLYAHSLEGTLPMTYIDLVCIVLFYIMLYSVLLFNFNVYKVKQKGVVGGSSRQSSQLPFTLHEDADIQQPLM